MPSDQGAPSGRFAALDQTFLTGTRTLEDLAAIADERGWSRMLVLTGPRTSQTTGFATLLAALGDRVADTFAEIRGHAPTPDTAALASKYRDARLDAIVAYGGGSVSDTAKGVSILLAEGGELEDHCSVFVPPADLRAPILREPKLPVIAVPTTLSGAEVTPGGGATTPAGIKRVFWDPKIASRVVCLDPRAIEETPLATLVSTGANALAHCAEGMYSRTRTTLSDAVAVEATRLLARGLTRQVFSDGGADEAANDMLSGAALSGVVISNARVCVHHAFCHVLGARFGVAHGDANAVMLPHALRFNESVTRESQEAFAAAVRRGVNEVDAPGVAIDGGDPAAVIASFLAAAGAPTRLRDVGVEQGQLHQVANEVLQDRGLYFNPRSVSSADELLPVLEAAW